MRFPRQFGWRLEMIREIEIVLMKTNVKATAIMLDRETPKTCEAVWNTLPAERNAGHASWSGECLTISKFGFPSDALKLENETIYVGPGEIALYPQNDEVLLFYGRGEPRFRAGPLRVNVFARILGDLEQFAEACRKVKTEAPQKIRFEKKPV